MTKDEILKKYEDDNEYHFHQVDREWIMDAVQEYADQQLRLGSVSFSLRDKFAMEAMNGELASQGGVDGCVWANEIDLAERAYLVADAMIKARSNES